MAAPRILMSILFGIGSAIVIGFVGPLYGGLVVVLSFALVFRSAQHVSLRWLFLGFAVTWVAVLAAGLGAIRTVPPDNALGWAVAGFVPLVLSGATVAVARARMRTSQLADPERRGPS